jgi:hypothetical protein
MEKAVRKRRMEVVRALEESPHVHKLYKELLEVMQAMDSVSALEPSGKLKSEFEKALKQELAASI